MDLKAFDDAFYRKLCGARLAPVLDAIVAMREAGIWLEITTLVIPGRNDDDAELRALTGWIVETLGPETPWHVSRFHPAFRMLDVPPTPARPCGGRRRSAGCRASAHVYIGNAPELGLEDTRCTGCGRMLIERNGLPGPGACWAARAPAPAAGGSVPGRWASASGGAVRRAR